MIRILIVDDEPLARSRLRRMLGAFPDCDVCGEAGSADEARQAIGELAPDLVLLDISMPGATGMALARELRRMDNPPAVVFCTAYPERALEAFDVAALDYLVKPVRPERLADALDKVRQFGAGGDAETYFLRSTGGGREVLIPIASVIALLAEDKYTTVVHADGEAVINDTLVQLEQAYPEEFCRVHRNALVARSRLRGLERDPSGAHRVILDGTEQTPEVSRRQLPGLRRILRERC